MKRKKKVSKVKRRKKTVDLSSSENLMTLHAELARLKKEAQKQLEHQGKSEDRLEDLEIHVNLLTRLLTTLCVEKFGMRVGVLKRLIKRIEKEAIRDSQILHLETLYKMPGKKDPIPPPTSKNDPWEEIS